ncbi:MAG: SseB family protein [Lachnospiraceae bacterium]|nr:SseB family protein [Lachnospiraceae bacterium]
MAVDKKFLARSIQKKTSLIVAYCTFTNMPLVVCDPETFNDQVWLFDSEEQLQEFAKPYTEQKLLLKGIKYPNKKFLEFFASLFTIGINEMVFVNSSGKQTLALEDMVRQPDYSKRPKEQQPVLNPQLQLTGLYFMQEAGRPVPNEQKTMLPDLEEELSVNLMKARYVVPIELFDGPESDAEKLQNRKYRLPILKNKNGDILQPLFTDPTELLKFNKENRFRAIVVPFDNLSKLLLKDAKGFLLNPGGFHLAMPRELLDGLKKNRFEL